MQAFIPGSYHEDGTFTWLNRKGIAFTHPFLDETIAACKHRALPTRTGTSAELLLWAAVADAVAPTALIFHVSRCGSTLLSQLLALDEKHIVLSEAPVLDQLLPHTPELVPAALRMLAQRQHGQETSLFVKTDSWHLCYYESLRRLFPGVPFILLYRAPLAVLHSQQRQRGRHAVPGLVPVLAPLWDVNNTEAVLDTYFANVLHRYYGLALEMAATDAHLLLLNYNEGPMAWLEKISAFTQTELTPTWRDAAYTRSSYHGKYPGQTFSEPAVTAPPPAFLQAALQSYHQLEAIRTSATPGSGWAGIGG